jgi:hypothetical protein
MRVSKKLNCLIRGKRGHGKPTSGAWMAMLSGKSNYEGVKEAGR